MPLFPPLRLRAAGHFHLSRLRVKELEIAHQRPLLVGEVVRVEARVVVEGAVAIEGHPATIVGGTLLPELFCVVPRIGWESYVALDLTHDSQFPETGAYADGGH